jgi:hypothetical protein
MNRTMPVFLIGVFLAAAAHAQQPVTADDVVNRAIVRENALLAALQTTTPVAETYIQDLATDNDFGTVPAGDHYFIGKIDLSHGITQTSYLPKSSDGPRFDLFSRFFTIRYLPRGFAQMMLIDGAHFDRAHYDFAFLRREFLGDVRTLIFAVSPRPGSGPGFFEGNIWVEDKGDNIVRFNGTYSGSSPSHMFLHFDSWRVNAGPDLWLPFEVYSQESHLTDAMKLHTAHFKALTRFWGYGGQAAREGGEFTNLTIQTAEIEDKSQQAADPSPVESLRAWQRLSEDNILDRLERAGLVSRHGGMDKVLDTVVNNLEVTNDLNITPEVRVRVLMTTPLESFTLGHTIVVSRGLLDTLPDEASLAAILAHELAHIALGHATSTDFAFSDRLIFDDARILSRFKLARTPAEEDAANEKAVALLTNSPYKDKPGQAGLFLKALSNESARLPCLIKPLFGDRLVDGHNIMRMAALMEKAPQLQTTRVDQVAALPLGSRSRLDPWTDDLEMMAMRPVPLVAASEKMPFEIAPVYLHLAYQDSRPKQVAETGATPSGN